MQKMPFQRKFPFIPKEKGFYIIRGPRQVGKGSWLKTILSHYESYKKCFFSNSQGEVDFVVPTRWTIEIKWSEVVLHLSKAYQNIHVPEKIVWTQNNFLREWPREG